FQYGTPAALVAYFRGKHPQAEQELKHSMPSVTDEDEPVLTRHTERVMPDVAQSADSVAIIGLSCRFPGGVASPESYWSLLRNGVDAIVEVPKSRWDFQHYYDNGRPQPGKIASKYGGFVDEVDQFDAEFFRISPREATHMDPQQR